MPDDKSSKTGDAGNSANGGSNDEGGALTYDSIYGGLP